MDAPSPGFLLQALTDASFRPQSAQNLAQISDLQAQLEEALKEKQEVQEKVGAPGYRPHGILGGWLVANTDANLHLVVANLVVCA